jgi:hypothetical protein
MAHTFETIVGELCQCGHERARHRDLFGGYVLGHGSCKKCSCKKFTWACFIFAGEEAETQTKEDSMD